jgi:hypothetical protein
MEKTRRNYPYGDCPALNGGPISSEHEARFGKQGGALGSRDGVDTVLPTQAAAATNDTGRQNVAARSEAAKEGAKLT